MLKEPIDRYDFESRYKAYWDTSAFTFLNLTTKPQKDDVYTIDLLIVTLMRCLALRKIVFG